MKKKKKLITFLAACVMFLSIPFVAQAAAYWAGSDEVSAVHSNLLQLDDLLTQKEAKISEQEKAIAELEAEVASLKEVQSNEIVEPIESEIEAEEIAEQNETIVTLKAEVTTLKENQENNNDESLEQKAKAFDAISKTMNDTLDIQMDENNYSGIMNKGVQLVNKYKDSALFNKAWEFIKN